MTTEPITYAAAGVDTEAGDRAVELMKASVAATHNTNVVGSLGGFAGLYDASFLKEYDHPLLATGTDGVGTKVAVAQAMDKHDTIGYDLVGMIVDDLVVTGAKSLFMTDYIACGKVVPERIAAIVKGIADACASAGCALIGGETAEHPGLLGVDEYDVAGAATGVVEAAKVLGAERVRAGDVVLAMPSSGLHSNGFSLVRRVLAAREWAYDKEVAEFGRTVGEEILVPTHVYTGQLLPVLDATNDIHAMSHVTGGGLAANLARVLPVGLEATVDRSTWTPPAVFQVIQELGGVPQLDIEGTLNQGVGMIAVVDAASVSQIQSLLSAQGLQSWQLGTVGVPSGVADAGIDVTISGTKGVRGGSVRMIGQHKA